MVLDFMLFLQLDPNTFHQPNILSHIFHFHLMNLFSDFLEVALDALERKLQRRLLDLGRKVDDRLDTLTATQNLVMDSCFDGGICRGLESRLSQVLEKIFDVFSDKIEGFSNR